MTSADRRGLLPIAQIHKKKYFGASRTWHVWNKLTARDVFALTQMPHYEGQHVYFHQNHPIQYVYLCGLVQQFDLAAGVGAAKYALLMLDDGSGRAIEVKIPRRHGPALDVGNGEVHPSNTLVDNLNVHDTRGLPSLFIDNQPVRVGSVLKVKGTIAEFRERQVELKRVFVVRDTNEEVAFWAGVARHRRDVLSKPWILSPADMKALDDQIEAETRKEEERQIARRAKYEASKERKAENDGKRQRHAERKRRLFDAGALKGSDVIKAPWE